MALILGKDVGVGFPVNFKSGGDTTRDAFHKHIQEIDKIYGHLRALDSGKVSAEDVSNIASKVTTLDGKVTTLDGKVTTLDGKVTTLTNKVNNIPDATGDIADIVKDIASLKAEVEKNKPATLKYRIMETMYSPVVKGSPSNIIQDTWTKGTSARLSYAAFEGDANYRIFTVPNGVYKIVIDACGGGGGGYLNSNGALVSGGNASSCKNVIYNVSPGDKLYIYAGRGGKGCKKTSASDNTCSDGEDTEVKLGSSTSTSSSAKQIIYCYGGYSAKTIADGGTTNKLPITEGASSGGTRYYQTNSRIVFSSNISGAAVLSGFSSESTLIPPYGEGGAFNTSWSRSDNFTGTYGVVVIRYVGIY